MFTGIIEDLGNVTTVEKPTQKPGGAEEIILRLTPKTSRRFNDVVLGESIAVNGVCLTVAEPYRVDSDLVFYLSSETMDRTQFRQIKPNSKVNLERSLKVSDRLSGHIVQGHVDGVGHIHSMEKSGEAYAVTFKIPNSLEKYCIEKGSISLNGVSLTINRIREKSLIDIMMIPHTWEHTQFHTGAVGDAINIEVDVLAKYIEKLCLRKP